ncbi:MAG: dNTP triphosphohydrolase [Nibricoccus sp.]
MLLIRLVRRSSLRQVGGMTNSFYTAFDLQTLGGERKTDYRNAFQIDRDRVIHSHAFRKLQSKTQVFLSGEYDFYRTRLTHSMEVAQIGRSICHYLKSRGALLREDFYIDSDLVEAVCLAHDLGHPPFGHSGERTLQELMKSHGGFEGNAQTLHLLTETMYHSENDIHGMQPTRALLDGVLKYKKLYSEFPNPPVRHFLYDPQVQYRSFVFDAAAIPPAMHEDETLNAFKSVECQIMDWADDAAYSLNDIIDGVKAGFLTIERVESWAAGEEIDPARQAQLDAMFNAIRADRLEAVFSQKIGAFIRACRLRERENFMSEKTNRYRFELVVDAEALREAEFYKRMANDVIFESPQLQQIEYKARRVMFSLWEAAWSNYVEQRERFIRILPPSVGKLVLAESSVHEKARRICDWLGSLTDGMIVRTYRRLFDPEFGSIRDLS